MLQDKTRGSLCGIVAKVLDCSWVHAIMLTFGLIPLGKIWTPDHPPAMGKIVLLLFFYKDGFGICCVGN